MADEEEIAIYDEVEIEDMTYDEALQIYHYPCPCGDRFEIALADLQDESNDIAVCPSCSLMIRVIFDQVGRLAKSKCRQPWLIVVICRIIFRNLPPTTLPPKLPSSRSPSLRERPV